MRSDEILQIRIDTVAKNRQEPVANSVHLALFPRNARIGWHSWCTIGLVGRLSRSFTRMSNLERILIQSFAHIFIPRATVSIENKL